MNRASARRRAGAGRERGDGGGAASPRRARGRARRSGRGRAPGRSARAGGTAGAGSFRAEHALDGGHLLGEGGLLNSELTAASGGDGVVAGALAAGGLLPFSSNPAALAKPLKGGVERTLIDLKHLARKLLHVLGDPVAVERAGSQRLEDEHVERAGNESLFG